MSSTKIGLMCRGPVLKSRCVFSLVIGIISFQFAGCNPYATRRLNLISNDNRKDSIYISYPIVKSRRQATKDYSYDEFETLSVLDTLTNRAIHKFADGRLRAKFGTLTDAESNVYTRLLDSILSKFMSRQYQEFKIAQNLDFSAGQNLIIIPHIVWTRSTEDYNEGDCGKVGYRDYVNSKYCTWTRSQTLLIMIDKRRREVIYFRYCQWDRVKLWLPFERIVNRSFRKCFRPILRKSG
jgi:hypothetical protein